MAATRNERIGVYIIAGLMALSVLGPGAFYIAQTVGSAGEEAAQLDEVNEAFACQADPDDYVDLAVDDPDPKKVDGDVEKLSVKDVKEGDGKEATRGACIVVFYHGFLASDASVFDSAFDRGTPTAFQLFDSAADGQGLITGFFEGIAGSEEKGISAMKVGGRRTITIPSEAAYGETERPSIPANSDLVFDVELVEIKEDSN